jgi:hypothetical protein
MPDMPEGIGRWDGMAGDWAIKARENRGINVFNIAILWIGANRF